MIKIDFTKDFPMVVFETYQNSPSIHLHSESKGEIEIGSEFANGISDEVRAELDKHYVKFTTTFRGTNSDIYIRKDIEKLNISVDSTTNDGQCYVYLGDKFNNYDIYVSDKLGFLTFLKANIDNGNFTNKNKIKTYISDGYRNESTRLISIDSLLSATENDYLVSINLLADIFKRNNYEFNVKIAGDSYADSDTYCMEIPISELTFDILMDKNHNKEFLTISYDDVFLINLPTNNKFRNLFSNITGNKDKKIESIRTFIKEKILAGEEC